jgi:hypothetical protein
VKSEEVNSVPLERGTLEKPEAAFLFEEFFM